MGYDYLGLFLFINIIRQAIQQTMYHAGGLAFRRQSPTQHKLRCLSIHAIMMVGEQKKEV